MIECACSTHALASYLSPTPLLLPLCSPRPALDPPSTRSTPSSAPICARSAREPCARTCLIVPTTATKRVHLATQMRSTHTEEEERGKQSPSRAPRGVATRATATRVEKVSLPWRASNPRVCFRGIESLPLSPCRCPSRPASAFDAACWSACSWACDRVDCAVVCRNCDICEQWLADNSPAAGFSYQYDDTAAAATTSDDPDCPKWWVELSVPVGPDSFPAWLGLPSFAVHV